jgi:predicted nucleotidyltransferase
MVQGDIEFVFEVVGTRLPQAGIDFLMVGGHAVNQYGYTRATIDVDFMVASADLDAARTVMKEAGFTNVSQSENVVFFNKPGLPIRVDFLKVGGATMQALLQDAREVGYGGQTLRVPSLENLIAMKLFALRSGSQGRWEKDFPDIVHLVVENRMSVGEELKPLCERYANDDIYLKLKSRIMEMLND